MTAKDFIAVVEDDREIGTLVADLLRREGFEAELCRSGEMFERLRAQRRIDLAILDIMLPGEDGLSICRRLRAGGEVPVLMVTAKADDIDRIVGLEIGADDYLPKPFHPRELIARVRAILRRTRATQRATPLSDQSWRFAGFLLDEGTRTLADPAGTMIDLTGGEFDLLVVFLRHPQRVLNRDQLLDWTRGRDANPYDRSIDVQVGRLRRKLAQHRAGAVLIKTVRGGGYILSAAVKKGP
jgi:two-component system, OmpR family, response regulator